MRSINSSNVISSYFTSKVSSEVVWEGNNVGDKKHYALSDNITKWDDRSIAVACYREVSHEAIIAIKSTFLSTTAWFCARLITSAYYLLCCRCGQLCKRQDGDVLLEFSTNYNKPYVKFFLYDTKSNVSKHFTFDSRLIYKPSNVEFDGNVTRHAGKIIFVNFKSANVLILDDNVVSI